jgi:hypothetical protein
MAVREDSVRRRPGIVVMLGVGAAIALVLAAAAPGGEALPEEPPLAGLTRDLVVAFAGDQPERCVFAAPGRELCTWQLPGRLFGPSDDPVAGGGVNLICELPIGISADLHESSGACRAHPRSAPAGDLPAVSAAPPAGHQPRALDLGSARTATSISHLVGDGPTRCKTRRNDQICDWELRQAEVGFAALASLARSGPGPVRLRCLLPLDGSPRRPSSCDVRRLD